MFAPAILFKTMRPVFYAFNETNEVKISDFDPLLSAINVISLVAIVA